MNKRRVVVGVSLILVLGLVLVGLVATPKPAEAYCWDYMANYRAYVDWCVTPGQDCLVVTCTSY